MTTSLLRAGWAGFAVFALAVLVTNGTEELVYTVVLCAIAALFLVLLRGRASRGTLLASGLLGVLLVVQQVAFLRSDLMEGESVTAVVDALGLLAGLAIGIGTFGVWRESRSARGAAVAV